MALFRRRQVLDLDAEEIEESNADQKITKRELRELEQTAVDLNDQLSRLVSEGEQLDDQVKKISLDECKES